MEGGGRDGKQVTANGSEEVLKGNSSLVLKGLGRLKKGDGYAPLQEVEVDSPLPQCRSHLMTCF